MSNLLENNQTMPPQISPKDIPPVGENSGSEEDEPVPPVIFENLSSSDDDAENMEDEEEVNLGYVELAQDEGDSEQATNLWSSQVHIVPISVFSRTIISWFLLFVAMAIVFMRATTLKPGIRNPESGITGHCFTNTESKKYPKHS